MALSLLCSFTCINAERKDTPFKFPFTQKDAKWKEFSSHQERLAALQIPNELLSSMSTKELFDCCFEFPYLFDVFAFDNIENGLTAVYSKFNGFRELFLRQDMIDVVIKEFGSISDNCENEKITDPKVGMLSLKIAILSYMIEGEEVLSNMTVSQLKELLKLAQMNIKTLSNHSAYKNSSGLFAIQKLVQSLNISGRTRTGEGEYYSTTRYTPNLSPVLAWKLYNNELSIYEKHDLDSIIVQTYHVPIIQESTRTYNCHAYAWHLSEGGDSVWIGKYSLTDENIYWTDNSYFEVPEDIATKVSYYESYDANHSAVRISNSLYRSKWGYGPLVEHSPNNCPYNTSLPKKFYARTPSIVGSSYIYDTKTYCILHLPSSCIVSWGISGSNASNFILSTDTPSLNQCTLTRKDDAVFSSSSGLYLTAQIQYNDSTIKTLTKSITTPYISGPTVPCGYSTYTVDGRPANSTIVWSRVGHGMITDTIFQQTDPMAYNLVNTDNRCIYGMLTAKVVVNNDTVGILNKRIDTGDGFTGTWYQPATATDTLNSTPQSFHNLSILDYVSGRTVYLMSDDFMDATVTHSGTKVLNWSNSNGVISFNTLGGFSPLGRSVPAGIVIEGTYPNSCKHFKLNLIEAGGIIPIILTYSTTGSGSYEFFLCDNTDGEQSAQRNVSNDEPWQLTIIRSDAGAKVYESSSSLGTKTVTTTGWPNGVYIATANITSQNYSVKFSVGR